jgi:hypothetical protein
VASLPAPNVSGSPGWPSGVRVTTPWAAKSSSTRRVVTVGTPSTTAVSFVVVESTLSRCSIRCAAAPASSQTPPSRRAPTRLRRRGRSPAAPRAARRARHEPRRRLRVRDELDLPRLVGVALDRRPRQRHEIGELDEPAFVVVGERVFVASQLEADEEPATASRSSSRMPAVRRRCSSERPTWAPRLGIPIR